MNQLILAGWLASLSVTEHVFFWIAIVASALLLVQIILLLVSFAGGMDVDADGDFDMDGDTDTDGGLSMFTLKGLIAFFALGGWCGFAAASAIDNVWAPVLIAVATGTVALLAVGFAMKGIAKLQCSGNLVGEKLTNATATVYVSIPAARQGRGKITLTAQGKFMELDAVTDEKEKISVDEQVVVLSYSDDFAVVKRLTEEEEKKPDEQSEENKE
ncbi:MAG: hypothetical protein K2N74_03855 [Clostridiales bacterium]|nr:hypothetical protein [Clostridiales bacterium]